MKNRRISAEVQIDPAAWAEVYGIDPDDLEGIVLDAREWAFNLLAEAARANGTLAR